MLRNRAVLETEDVDNGDPPLQGGHPTPREHRDVLAGLVQTVNLDLESGEWQRSRLGQPLRLAGGDDARPVVDEIVPQPRLYRVNVSPSDQFTNDYLHDAFSHVLDLCRQQDSCR